jgi:signal transduction histidine kinase
MSTEPSTPVHGRSVWGTLARRLDPFLDPAIGVVAAVLALTAFLTADIGELDPRLQGPNAVAAIATVVAAGSLAWRRRRPRVAYGVFVAGALVVSGSFHYIASLSLMLLFSLYSLTTHASRRDAAVGLGVGVASFVGLALAKVPDLSTKDLWLSVALLVAAWAVGEVVRTRREWQGDQVRAAITEERLRIARELHDVVAHSMSLIAVQAGVGAHVIRTDPVGAGQALEVIAETSRKALEQTRSILGMLREEDDSGVRPPTQGLDELPGLVQDVRAAGLDVDLARSGTARPLTAAVSLAAYRIVQESLTNVLKHSAASSATVTVTFTQHQLDVDVRDPGPLRATAMTGSAGHGLVGHGLIGLDERVRLVGGALAYGGSGNGFCVHATLSTGARR